MFCQLTNTSECDSTSRNFSSTTKELKKPVPYFNVAVGQTFRSSAVSVFWKLWGKLSFNKVLRMRNKYRNRLDMHKTGGNARRLKLTNLQPVSKNLQTQAKGKVRTVEPGLWSRNSNFASVSRHPKIFDPAQERFVPLKTKKLCIICTCSLPYKIRLLNGNSNFRLRFHHSFFWFRLRLHSPGWN